MRKKILETIVNYPLLVKNLESEGDKIIINTGEEYLEINENGNNVELFYLSWPKESKNFQTEENYKEIPYFKVALSKEEAIDEIKRLLAEMCLNLQRPSYGR